MGNWPPTECEALLMYAEQEKTGILLMEPKYNDALIDEGLIAPRLVQYKDLKLNSYDLTEKGQEAVEMLQRKRTESKYRMPNWLLVEVTK